MALYVNETGPVTAPTIVFLHGGGVGGWMWQRQTAALTDYHCLVPDMPEQGRSIAIKPLTIPDTAAQIADLIRLRAHGGVAHLVGLSLGAQVGVQLLALAPKLIDHALISSALVHPLPGGWMLRPGLLKWLFRLSVSPFKNSQWWARINMRYAAGIPEEYFAQYFEEYRAMTDQSFADVMIVNQQFRIPKGLDNVKSPVLMTVGQKEYKVMQDSARDLAAAIPGSRAYVVDHDPKLSMAQQHNWSMNAPEMFTETVRAWITNQPLPAGLQPLV